MTNALAESSCQADFQETVVELTSIRHQFRGGSRPALDGIDLRIGRGIFALLGPNGAGKSTLMRILCTALVPTAGRATILGCDVVAERRAARRLFGYLPQEFGAWRQHRVDEVLDTMAMLSGLESRAARRDRLEAVLREVGLEPVVHRKVKHLSGGMVRRLGLAQALIAEPPVLVIDEPTVGMDPEERLRFRELIAELATRRTILLSTHIVADLGSACRDLALLVAGAIVFRGAPEALLERARGRVFEIQVEGPDEEEALGGGFEVVSRQPLGQGFLVRGVGPRGQLPVGAAAVADVTLEEAYLAFVADGAAT